MLFDRESDAVHVVMNLGMALMLAPFFAPQWHYTIVAAYSLTVAVLVVQIIWRKYGSSSASSTTTGGTVYHIAALLAMIYASLQMSHSTMLFSGLTDYGAHMLEMPQHHAPEITHTSSNWIVKGLGYLFLLDGLLFLAVGVAFPAIVIAQAVKTPSDSSKAPATVAVDNHANITRADVRLGALPHIIMDAGMVYMLLVPGAMVHSA